MNVLLHRIFSRLHYQWNAQTQYYLHSPFAFQFFQNAIVPARTARFQKIEDYRRQLLQNPQMLSIHDLGAGSHSGFRSVGSICAATAIPARYGALLHHTCLYFQPQLVVELGTSLGLSTAYIAAALPHSRIFSFEGNPEVARFAENALHQYGWKQTKIMTGHFDTTLPDFLENKKIDLAFIDGNHRYEPTVRYFEWLLKAAHADTVLIFDDIYWSPEMTRAWRYIQSHSATKTTFDFWRMGFVFLRNQMLQQQHFTLRY